MSECVPGAWATSDFVLARTLRIYRGVALLYVAAVWALALVEHPAAWIPTQASYWALGVATLYYLLSLFASASASPRTCRAAAALQHVAAAASAATTLLFWAFVFPGKPVLAATTLMLHGGLVATLAIDLVLARLPYIVTDLVWTLLFAIAYVLFALAWWAAGRAATTRLYVFLDFDDARTGWIVLALFTLAALADVAMLGVSVCGRALAARLTRGKSGSAAYRVL